MTSNILPDLKHIIGLALLGLFLSSFTLMNGYGQETLLSINGENISEEEFAFFMKANRALCYSYFYTEHNVSQNPEFWTSSYSGERPIDYIRNKTLEILTEVKINLILARELGIIDDVSFKAFLYRFEQENKRRKAAIDKGELIYGPKEYKLESYFSYWYSNILISLRKQWGNGQMIVSDSISAYYNRLKNDYRIPDEISIIQLSIPYTDQKDKEDALQWANEILSNNLFDDTLCLQEGINCEKFLLSANENIEAEEQILELYTIARNLKPGETEGPITDNRSKQIRLVRCERIKEGYIPALEDIEPVVIQKYKDDCFQSLINERVNKAIVKIITSDINEALLNYLK